MTSWKEIAAYLNTSVRSVQRWEKTEALPVRRHEHESLGRVFAIKTEVDAWLQSRTSLPEQKPQAAAPVDTVDAVVATNRWPVTRLLTGLVLLLGCAALVGLWVKRDATTQYERIRPLTSMNGMQALPEFSPDGKRVVFTFVPDGDLDGADLYEVVLDSTGPPRRLTSAPGMEYSAAWSRDGERIAFIRNEQLWALHVASRAETMLSAQARCGQTGHAASRCIAWMEDNRTLLLLEQTSTDTRRLFEFDPETNQRRLAVALDGSGERAMSLSADGRLLAHVTRHKENEDHLCVFEFASRQDACFPSPVEDVMAVDWMPGAKELMISGRRDEERGVWRVGLGERHTVRPVVSRRDRSFAEFRVSPVAWDGGVNVVYTDAGTRTMVKTMSLAKPGMWRAVANHPAAAGPRQIDPQFSPDGQWVAFSMGRGTNQEIWVCRAGDGSELRQITHGTGEAGTPRWSPDGKYIAYDRTDLLPPDIHVVEVASGVSRRLSSPASHDARPSWSRDGQWIYFSSNRLSTYQIWKMHPDGSGTVRLTEGTGFEPLESFDGSEVYFLRATEAPGLWSVPVSGGAERLVHPEVWQGLYGVGPDGILFADTVQTGRSQRVKRLLMLDPVAGQTRVAYGDGWLTEAGTPALAISRDARMVAAVHLTITANLKVIHGLR